MKERYVEGRVLGPFCTNILEFLYEIEKSMKNL
jgi:hypothetical protein